MKISQLITHAFLGTILITTSLIVNAGQVFRFQGENGVITMSKTLPPYAAQKGYDILDDTTMRVIEKVAPALTKAEITEYNRQQAAHKEQQQLAVTEAKKQAERNRQARLYDNNLRARYRSEEDLLTKRETELLYFQNQIDKTNADLTRNNDKLHQFQQQAANIELNGRSVGGNLKKRLIATEQEINNNKRELTRLTAENKASIIQFDQDLLRLQQLLGTDTKQHITAQ
jgi:hypothetical protein